MRIDLWGGHHRLLGRPVGLVEAAKAFAFPFLAVNVLIVVQSRLIGRYLCGFVCPVGALARLAEWLRWRDRSGALRLRRHASMLGICLVLAAITFSFWVDWRVFLEGSALARGLSAAFLVGTTLALWGTIWFLGLGFCRNWCPSGVYFAVLGEKTANGVEFAHPETCTDCKACEKVCPMDLEPTHLDSAERREGSGFYPDGLSNHAVCIRCGDCVVACEGTTSRLNVPTPLRLGWLEGGPGAEARPRERLEGGAEPEEVRA